MMGESLKITELEIHSVIQSLTSIARHQTIDCEDDEFVDIFDGSLILMMIIEFYHWTSIVALKVFGYMSLANWVTFIECL